MNYSVLVGVLVEKWRPVYWRTGQQRQAFSFVELLIVVMLLGVMAGVAAPKYRAALEATHLECVAKRLAADLRRARSEAQQFSTSRTIVFDSGNGSYSSADMTMLDRPSEPLWVSLASAGFAVKIDTVDFNGTATVTFDLYGHSQNAGYIELILNGRTAAILLYETGSVEVLL